MVRSLRSEIAGKADATRVQMQCLYLAISGHPSGEPGTSALAPRPDVTDLFRKCPLMTLFGHDPPDVSGGKIMIGLRRQEHLP